MAVKNLYKLFIDSGAFIAIMDKKDPFHQIINDTIRKVVNAETIDEFFRMIKN